MPAKAYGGLWYRWSGFTVEQMPIVRCRGPQAKYSTFPCSQSLHSNINQTGHCCLLWLHAYCLFSSYCGSYGSCVCIYLWTLQPALYVCFGFFLLCRLKSIEINSSLRCHQLYRWWTGTCSSVMAISSCQATSISQSWRVPCGLAPGKFAVMGAPPHSFPGAVNILKGKFKKKKGANMNIVYSLICASFLVCVPTSQFLLRGRT